jgi:ribosomal protein S6E (S10)
MRIFKYWTIQTTTIRIDDLDQISKVYGGSNYSREDADQDALKRIKNIEQIIQGQMPLDEDYEADIIEEIIDRLDEQNVVTRNRYGSLVLNSDTQMFIDVDNVALGLWDKLFNKGKSKKEINLARIRKTISKRKYSELGFIIYETFKGYRIAVTGDKLDPRSKKSKSMMKDFKADYLYRLLCRKQNCYRARLTPKPHRIGQPRLKMVYPNRSEDEQAHHESWVKSYDDKSSNFITCKKIEQHGRVLRNRILDYHDQVCRVGYNQKLA